jgi:predicted ATPase
LRYFCSPHHQDSALHPTIVQLERAAGFARDDTTEEKLGKLRALLMPRVRGDDDIELLAELLSLPNTAAELSLSPQRKREMLFEALLHQLKALSPGRPVLMVFEDAHWIDPTSRELLDLILERVRSELPGRLRGYPEACRRRPAHRPHRLQPVYPETEGRKGRFPQLDEKLEIPAGHGLFPPQRRRGSKELGCAVFGAVLPQFLP